MRSTWTMTSKLRALASTLASTLGLASALGLVGSFAAGCLVTNQNHCGLNAGACGDGMMCSVCAVDNNGCVPSDSVLDAGCQFGDASTGGPTSVTGTTTVTNPTTTTESTVDPSISTTFDPTTSTVGPTTEVTGTSTVDPSDPSTATTMMPPCDGPVVDNPNCSGDTPYCIDQDCVGCTDPGFNCATVDPMKPACEETSNLCVECQSHSDCLNADKPACDLDTATCKPCISHDECEATACDLETGECLPESCVYYVDATKGGNTPCAEDNDGKTKEQPICSLQKAVTLLQPGKPCTIKVKAGSQFQTLPTVVAPGDITVAIVHYGDTPPTLQVPTDPAITVQSGNRVYMDSIAITNSVPTSSPAIECDDAILWLDNQRVNNTKTALHANECRVHVRRSIIFGHTFGGLDIQGNDGNKAQLWLENTYITSMNSSIFGAIRLFGAAKADLLYSTIALVKSAVPTIECVGGFTGTIKIRNSAIIGAAPLYGVACVPKLTKTTSHESNEGSQAELSGTFSSFFGGQYQAKVNGTLLDVAEWLPGDPKLDQDGTHRPKVQGPDYAGADRPVR